MNVPTEHPDRLYGLLDQLRDLQGTRTLADCTGRAPWPQRGVYFFFEPGEVRTNGAPRVVRVGTHALTAGSRTTLWQRLSQHRGTGPGPVGTGGNHRGSVFRLHVGTALLNRDPEEAYVSTATKWAQGSSASTAVRSTEIELEKRVSAVIRSMPFVFVAVDDAPGRTSDRGLIESGAIALLSRISNPGGADPPSSGWLGFRADRAAVRDSGLWNVRHVTDEPRVEFLEVLARRVDAMTVT